MVLSADGASHSAALGAADRIVLVDDPLLAAYAPEPFVAALQEVVAAEQPSVVLIGATSIGWDLAPLLAARLDLPLVTGCKAIQAEGQKLRVTASFCGGKMTAQVLAPTSPAIVMVLPGSFRPNGEAGKAVVQQRKLAAPLSSGAVNFQQWILPEGGDLDITQQEILVAVGRGIQQKENLEVAEELAQALGGALCASRPVIDQGWLPATRQVGKSGMTVKPRCFLALGISGAGTRRRHEGFRLDRGREHGPQGPHLRRGPLRRRGRRARPRPGADEGTETELGKRELKPRMKHGLNTDQKIRV